MPHSRRWFCTALVSLVLAGCASGERVDARSTGASGKVAALLEREQAWTNAMRGHDYEALDDIMGAEFRLTFVEVPPFAQGESSAISRAMWLENLQLMTFGPITMGDQRVNLHGEDVATVRMRMTLEKWMVADVLLPPVYDVTDVWVHREGRWQVISRISEPLAPQQSWPAAE